MRTLGVPLAALALMVAAGTAQADCAEATASPAAASAAIVKAIGVSAEAANGAMACMVEGMTQSDFRIAVVDAAAQIDDQATALMVIELGSAFLFAQVEVAPDAILMEPPASES